ncbi:MAG: hypothetical protein IH600_01535 [Bacteroidetes bacterium]|nr:hypothetical protein [Bacteroidota bacterium]
MNPVHSSSSLLRLFLCAAAFAVPLVLMSPASPAQGISLTSADGSVTATWLRPFPQGNTLRDLCFVDSRHGWAVGDAGTILHTTDGGENWSALARVTDESLCSVTFTDSAYGWVAGCRAMLHTTDGGKNWSALPVPTSSSHRELCVKSIRALSPTSLMLLTEREFWYSADGGQHWQVSYETYSAMCMCFADARHGWIGGSRGRIARTTDTGISWTEHWAISEDRATLGIHFCDSLHGIACGERSTHFTRDGGQTWIAAADTVFGATAPFLVDSLSGFITAPLMGSTHMGVFRTSDGGFHWKRMPGTNSYPLNAIGFADQASGLAVGQDGLIVTTSDGGSTWHGRNDVAGEKFYSVAFPSADGGWAVGEGVFRTHDGGVHWERVHELQDTVYHAVYFIDEREGWIVGGGGLLRYTTDGGAKWMKKELPVGGYGYLSDVYFISPSRGWITAERGTLFETSDGGNSWKQHSQIIHGDLTTVCFRSESIGYCLGEREGVFLKTSDGGTSWHSMSFGKETRLRDIALLGGDRICLLARTKSDQTMILISSDGGENWMPNVLNGAPPPLSMHFSDDRRGWLLASGGEVWLTEDGGERWQPLPLPLEFFNSADIASPSSDRAFIVGFGGGVMRLDLHR